MWVNFDELPLQSRVWVFQSNRIMSPSEQSSIDDAVKEFVQKWSTHGVQMLASHVLYHNCFVVIAADEQKQVSRCWIRIRRPRGIGECQDSTRVLVLIIPV